MLRLAVVCAMLCGCNVVFGVDRDEPAACGPYAGVAPVVFDPSLSEMRELSIDGTGVRGMVWAHHAGLDGPVALTLVDGVWTYDDARTQGLGDRDGARLVWRDDELFSWKATDLDEYVFTAGQGWTYWARLVDTGTDSYKRPGNAIELSLSPSSVQRLLVETQIPLVGRSQIVIRSLSPTDENWQPTERLRAFADATPPIAASLGLLTSTGEGLVYAATVGDETTSHLYASHVNGDGRTFDPGARIEIDGLGDDVSVTEPWIDEDCSDLWFTADGAIWHAVGPE